MNRILDPELAAFLGDLPGEGKTPPPLTTAQRPAPPPADPLAVLDGIAEKKPDGKRKDYPTFPDALGEAAQLAARSLELADLADQLETNNRQLGEMIVPFWFSHWQGKAETEAGVLVDVPEKGKQVRVVCQAKLVKMASKAALDPIRPLLGGKEADLFHDTFALKIDGEKIPPAAMTPLVTELKALFAKHGASKALTAERQYKAYPAFHTQRHVLFTPEQNLKINQTVRLITQVKSKNVSG